MRRLDSVMKVRLGSPANIPSHVKLERYELRMQTSRSRRARVDCSSNDHHAGDKHSEIIDDLESARKYIFVFAPLRPLDKSQFSLPSLPLVTRRAMASIIFRRRRN